MRNSLLAFTAVLMGLVLGTLDAKAGHRWHGDGYYKTDRFAYRYAPRGYYPYYNSGQWRSVKELRFRRDCCRPVADLPPYYQAWGHPHPRYTHRKWHRRHHGRIRLGHW